MEWLTPWYSIEDDPTIAAAMEQELLAELATGHALYGLRARAIGRRQDCDDVLFALDDGMYRVAVVHLTWTRTPPERLPFPITVLYPDIANWLDDRILRDHDDLDV